jgi:phenylacetate-coenzyme A ligase PaaK-like adenylate-forming protein
VTTGTTAAKDVPSPEKIKQAREKLDAHVREIVAWHFSPDSGAPFWLERAKSFKFNPLKDVRTVDDLKLFGMFEDDWLRGGPLQRWIPRGLKGKPIYVFETGGTTGIPKSRIASEDWKIDYELMSETLPDQYFPRGANWLMLGPSGPRRLRLAIEHLAQHRGGICFCVDLDPRWVVRLLKDRRIDEVNRYKEHCIEQALTVLKAGHDIKCMFTTPKLLEALAQALEKQGRSIKDTGITGIFSGGTEFTPQFTRFAVEELLDNGAVYMTPTYGNTLMGLACSKPVGPEDGYKISYYPPQPRAAVEVVQFDNYDKVVEYGQTGRVLLTTLTKEFFMPRFPERDEGEREAPYIKYPWDGVSGVRPFREFAATTTVGVY